MSFQADEILDGSIDDVVKRLKQVDATYPDEILNRVTEIISDQDRAEVVRAEAAMALGRCSTSSCRSTLKSLLSNEIPTLRRLAVTGLGADQADETIHWLIQMLADPVNKVRNDAERALMKRERQMASIGVEALLAMLNHPVALTRSPAARLLGQSKDDRALQPLLKMIESEEWLERMWAAKSLGDLGKAASIPVLTEKVKTDEKNRVRAAAADALGAL
ncbi:MAG: HEAT repeat domain-containing protein, partial [Planctomicrobium sp.]|nr:HEAT repeat domain-containing protein [Planctomicrobium sp.]